MSLTKQNQTKQIKPIKVDYRSMLNIRKIQQIRQKPVDATTSCLSIEMEMGWTCSTSLLPKIDQKVTEWN